MATINNIADLVKILEDNPEWLLTIRGLIISKEISDLPGSLQELKGTVNSMNATLTNVSSQLDSLDKNGTGISGRVDDLDRKLTSVSSRVDNLTGADYEGQAAHFGRRRLRDTLQVNNHQLMYQYRRQGQEELRKFLLQAATDHGLSREDQDDLEQTDLIFWVYGSSPDSQGVVTAHVAAEVSITIKADDVVRARRRAQILASCTTIPCLPAVIGTAITPEAKSQLGDDVTAVGMTQDGQGISLPLADPETPPEP